MPLGVAPGTSTSLNSSLMRPALPVGNLTPRDQVEGKGKILRMPESVDERGNRLVADGRVVVLSVLGLRFAVGSAEVEIRFLVEGDEICQQRYVAQAADAATVGAEPFGPLELAVDEGGVHLDADAVVEVVSGDELGDGALLVLVGDVGNLVAAEFRRAEERVLLGGREVKTAEPRPDRLEVDFLVGCVAATNVATVRDGWQKYDRREENTTSKRNEREISWKRRERE